MELKQYRHKNVLFCLFLLIVPYGIETKPVALLEYLIRLLIVPYGIETAFRNKGKAGCLHF